jgi:hypothetical protein
VNITSNTKLHLKTKTCKLLGKNCRYLMSGLQNCLTHPVEWVKLYLEAASVFQCELMVIKLLSYSTLNTIHRITEHQK